jgi:hypothetical protein
MPEDVTEVRLRLAQIVARAETDDEFRQRLASDPAAVLAENDIPDGAVEEYSQALQEGRSRRQGFEADDGEEVIPCIHTAGCNDFTCIATICGPTCFVTIHIDAPDS